MLVLGEKKKGQGKPSRKDGATAGSVWADSARGPHTWSILTPENRQGEHTSLGWGPFRPSSDLGRIAMALSTLGPLIEPTLGRKGQRARYLVRLRRV